MKALRPIGRRMATALPSVVGVIIVTFLLTRVLPGDTAAYFAGPAATPTAIAEIKARLGLDQRLGEPVRRLDMQIGRQQLIAVDAWGNHRP